MFDVENDQFWMEKKYFYYSRPSKENWANSANFVISILVTISYILFQNS